MANGTAVVFVIVRVTRYERDRLRHQDRKQKQ